MFAVYLLAGQVLDGDFIKPDGLCNFSLNLLCTGIIFRRWGRFLILSAPAGLFVLIGDGTDEGLPTATELSGMSFATTLPPPMTTLLPMVTPGITCTPAPIQTLSPTVIG